jgi:hypothetical protein
MIWLGCVAELVKCHCRSLAQIHAVKGRCRTVQMHIQPVTLCQQMASRWGSKARIAMLRIGRHSLCKSRNHSSTSAPALLTS